MTRLLTLRRQIPPLWLLGACLLALATEVWPQMETEHTPRHGGYFGDADDLYHYEVLLVSPRRVILYVNDEFNQPLDVRPLQGRWILTPDDPAPLSGALTPSADGVHFFADLPPTNADPIHLAVAVLKGRDWATMEFYLPAPSQSGTGSTSR